MNAEMNLTTHLEYFLLFISTWPNIEDLIFMEEGAPLKLSVFWE